MASMRSSFCDQSILETLLPLSNALMFTHLKANPTFNSEMELRAETNRLIRERTVGVYVFVFPQSIHRGNFDTVIEQDQVLRS